MFSLSLRRDQGEGPLTSEADWITGGASMMRKIRKPGHVDARCISQFIKLIILNTILK